MEAGERLESWGVVNPNLYHWHTGTALALQAVGEEERARELEARQLAVAERWGAPRALAEALRTGALLARGADQVEGLEAALDALGDSSAELVRARLLTDLGAALRRGNSRSAARPILSEALELARRCGARPLADRAHTELWATGARPRDPPPHRRRQPDPERAPHRPPRRLRPLQHRHRPDPLRHGQDGRDAPHPDLPQAGGRLPPRPGPAPGGSSAGRDAPRLSRAYGFRRRSGGHDEEAVGIRSWI